MFLEFVTWLMHQLRLPKGGTSRWVTLVVAGHNLRLLKKYKVLSKDKSLCEGIWKLGRKMMVQYYYPKFQ